MQSSLAPLPVPQGASIAGNSMVKIMIGGLVTKPGDYWVEKGTPLEEVLRKAHPKRLANLRGIDLKIKLEKPLQIHIEELEDLHIYLEGAIDPPSPLTVPVRTRVCDLKKYIPNKALIDPLFFRSKRLLREGERLFLPPKIDAEKTLRCEKRS